jgi:outer membrane lipoprotein LolB
VSAHGRSEALTLRSAQRAGWPVRRRAVLAAATFAGCASLKSPPDLSGRLAVRVASDPPRSLAADFDLRGSAERGALSLTGPLGAILADVRWQPGEATMTDAQGARRYPTLDALSRDLLGESLPLAALTDWLRGRPWPGAPSKATAEGFEQLGWRIGLEGLAEGLVVAARDSAPAVSVRARLEKAPT